MKLESPIKLSERVCQSHNLVGEFLEKDLEAIGRAVVEGYKLDLESRADWEKRYEAAMNLALQLAEAKTFPWPGASNIKFPLVTIAALQWHSRAYPVLVNGPDIVKCRVRGADPGGERTARARRIGAYMSWQLLEEDEAWEEETDRSLIQLPIIGCTFKKSRRDSVRDCNVSEHVSAKDFVLNYYSRSVESAPRKTHVLYLHRNELIEKMRLGSFTDYVGEEWLQLPPAEDTTATPNQAHKRTGVKAPSRPDDHTPFKCLEQHVLMDLDGDHYAEPYIITVEAASGRVLRIVTGFEWKDVQLVNGKVALIRAQQYFTKYSFIPSPDGGIYDMGFGLLLGHLNSAVDSIINMLVDAGTLSTTAGGFLGKGVKIRGGEMSFRPFGWNRVDSTGEDLAKGIYALPVREPSNVLFQLLGLLIDYTNRISGSTDIMVGENPGQNTPAQTSQLMAEQGAKINSAIFKRVWRCMKQEYVKLYELNAYYLQGSKTFGDHEEKINSDDFTLDAKDIRPAADPNLTSDVLRMQQASAVAERAMAVPGYDRTAVEKRYLAALKVEDIDVIFPGPEKMPAPPPLKIVLEQMKDAREMGKVKTRIQEKLMELAASRAENAATVEYIKAQTIDILTTVGAKEGAAKLTQFEAALKAAKQYDDSMVAYMKLFQDMSQQNEQSQQPGAAGKPNGPGAAGGGVQPMASPSGDAGGMGGSPAAGSPGI